MQNNNYNQIFDDTVRTDTLISIKEIPLYPRQGEKYSIKLIFDESKVDTYYGFEMLDNSCFTHEEKIQFLNNFANFALKNTYDRFYLSLYRTHKKVDFFVSNQDARFIIEDCFENRIQESFNNKDGKYYKYKYVYLSFKILYDYIGTYELTKEILDNLGIEGHLILNLIHLGYESDALHYFEKHINNLIELKSVYGFTNEFLETCFLLGTSSHETIRLKAIDLIIVCVSKYPDIQLLRIAEYLDKEKTMKVLENHFLGFQKYDFSHFDYKNNNVLNNDDYRKRGQYMNFMTDNAHLLGEIFGLLLWKEFVKNLELYQHYDNVPFLHNQLTIIEGVFKNTHISLIEKKQILFQFFDKDKLIRYSDYKDRYWTLIEHIFPDGVLLKEEVDKLFPDIPYNPEIDFIPEEWDFMFNERKYDRPIRFPSPTVWASFSEEELVEALKTNLIIPQNYLLKRNKYNDFLKETSIYTN